LQRDGFLYFYRLNKYVDFMTGVSAKKRVLIGLAALILLMHACITDEFRFKDMTIDEDWEIGILSPLFLGNLEFRDFIHDWKTPVPNNPPPFVILDYVGKPDVKIPTQLIFDRSAVIDSFPFYIQGSYQFTAVDLVFTVSNGSPFPLHLEMYFFDNKNPLVLGPSISPNPFKEANFGVVPAVPVITSDTVQLNNDQLAKLKSGNRMRFVSWYDKNSFIDNKDTLSAHYPINVSIVLVGKMKAKKDD
jgi:hypothetical protein